MQTKNKINVANANYPSDCDGCHLSVKNTIYILGHKGFREEWNTLEHDEQMIAKIEAICNKYDNFDDDNLIDEIEQHTDIVEYINNLISNETFVLNCLQMAGL